jgi:hypothetical protein
MSPPESFTFFFLIIFPPSLSSFSFSPSAPNEKGKRTGKKGWHHFELSPVMPGAAEYSA